MYEYNWNFVDHSIDVSDALVVSSKQEMLDAGWSWTGCETNDHGGSSLSQGIWCHSGKQMHLKVPLTTSQSTRCTATWMNDYSGGGNDGFVRLMKNGVQLGEARQNQQSSVTFDYHPGDALEFWEGFAIAKVGADWIKCGIIVDRPDNKIDISSALVISTKQSMLDAGWGWTGCTTSHHGGQSLQGGIWCHSGAQMHLKIPIKGGPAMCKAKWRNNYSGGGNDGFVRLMKNGVQLGEARQLEDASATFNYVPGDALEFWEGFAIAMVKPDWLVCEESHPVVVQR